MNKNMLKAIIAGRGLTQADVSRTMKMDYILFRRKMSSKFIDPKFAKSLIKTLNMNDREVMQVFFND